MRIDRLYIIALVALAFTLVGCGKEKTEAKPQLDGYVILDIDSFVEMGYSKTFDLKEISHFARTDGENDRIGYYFTLPVSSKRDTVKLNDSKDFLKPTYTFTVPDSLGLFTIYYSGYSDDYYDTKAYTKFYVVKGGLNGNSSITNFEINDDDKQFVDERDSKAYYYTTVEGTDWMRQNLAWEGAGKPYVDCRSMTDILGQYYTQTEAAEACPEGWRLPTDAEWVALAKAFGAKGDGDGDLDKAAGPLMENVYFNGERFWAYWRNVKITNAARVSLLPGGYAVDLGTGDADFTGFQSYGAFWTADKADGKATFRYIFEEEDILYKGSADPDGMRMPVRCVR